MSTNKLNWLITIAIIIILLLIGLVCARMAYKGSDKYDIYSSVSFEELKSKVSLEHIVKKSITSCKWYEEIIDNGSFGFTSSCLDGGIVLEAKYYNFITSNFKWDKYTYPTSSKEDINADVYGSREIYGSSMIKNILRTKKLYMSKEYVRIFEGSDIYFFLDKESKTLYFYNLIL